MSINLVVLDERYELLLSTGKIPFLLNEGESIRFRTSTSRQSLAISSQDSTSRTINIKAKDGYVFLTTIRIVFVTVSSGDINSFLIDLTNSPSLQFSHKLVSPWFGANYWEFLFNSGSSSDGFPTNQWFKGTIMFNDGGLFEFINILNLIINDVVHNVDIDDELPQYSA